MSVYVSVDLHRRRSLVCFRLDDGSLSYSRLLNSEETLVAAVFAAGPDPVVAIEATYGWYWAVDCLHAAGAEVKLVHPNGVNWGNRRVKNDKEDCAVLLDLLERGRLPESWIAPIEVRELRELVRNRHRRVQDRTRFKNEVHGIIAKHGLVSPMSDVFGPGGREWLTQIPLSPNSRIALEMKLDAIDHATEQIRALEQLIIPQARGHQAWQALLTIPQIGPVTAAILIAEIGDIHRFPNARRFSSWCGLTPKRTESDGKGRNGRITKQGSRLIRWALVEAAVRNQSEQIKSIKAQLKARGVPARVGHVAGARKLATMVFYAMRDLEVHSLKPEAA